MDPAALLDRPPSLTSTEAPSDALLGKRDRQTAWSRVSACLALSAVLGGVGGYWFSVFLQYSPLWFSCCMSEDALANAYYIQWVAAAGGLVVAALAASVHELFFPNTVRNEGYLLPTTFYLLPTAYNLLLPTSHFLPATGAHPDERPGQGGPPQDAMARRRAARARPRRGGVLVPL